MANDITILSCPICNNPKLREYGNGIYQCDVCETFFDKDENIVLTEQEWLQTCTTEQLAEWIVNEINERVKLALHDSELNDGDVNSDDYMEDSDDWVEWLKQPHKENEWSIDDG